MRKKHQLNLSALVDNLQKELVERRPTLRKMYDEVRMMKFVIRPLQGDIMRVDFNDSHLIETLWSLGKLDEFFQKKLKTVPSSQRESFMRLFDTLHQQFQGQLNKLNLRPEKQTSSSTLEMEIFKQRSLPKKSNCFREAKSYEKIPRRTGS